MIKNRGAETLSLIDAHFHKTLSKHMQVHKQSENLGKYYY